MFFLRWKVEGMNIFGINLPKKLKYTVFVVLPAFLALSRAQILHLLNCAGYIVLLDRYKELLYIHNNI